MPHQDAAGKDSAERGTTEQDASDQTRDVARPVIR